MAKIACPHCSASLNAPDTVLGKSVRCPKCGEKFTASAPEAATPDPFDDPFGGADPLAGSPLGELPGGDFGNVPAPAIPTSIAAPAAAARSASATKEAPGSKRFLPLALGCGALLVTGLLGGAIVCAGVFMFTASQIDHAAVVSSAAAEAEEASYVTLEVARDPIPSRKSSQLREMAPDANAAEWKVTVDPAERVSGLKSAILLPEAESLEEVLLSDTSSGAAVVRVAPEQRGLIWTRYDLKQTEPLGETTLYADKEYTDFSTKFRGAAMSPSGKRLALADPYAEYHKSAEIVVFDEQGNEVSRAKFDETGDDFKWLAFAGDSRLLVQLKETLHGIDVETGETAFSVPGFKYLGLNLELPGDLGPTVSPGGKFVVGLNDEGFVWLSCEDGSRAGLSVVPSVWFQEDTTRYEDSDTGFMNVHHGRMSIRPDGKTAAMLILDINRDLCLTEIDVATGKVLDGMVIPRSFASMSWLTNLDCVWVGERQLIAGEGHLIDFAARYFLVVFELNAPLLPRSPDGRCWRVLGAPEDAAVRQKLGLPAAPSDPPRKFLAASTLPPANIAEQIASAKQGGLFWHPGISVRLQMSGEVPANERQKLIDAFADVVVANGYRIDPKSSYAVRIKFDSWDGEGMHYTGGHEVSIRDLEERPFFQSDSAGYSRYTVMGQERSDLWQLVRDEFDNFASPPIYLRDVAGKQFEVLPYQQYKWPVGVDDLYPPPPFKEQPRNYAGLPGDVGYVDQNLTGS